MKKRILKTLFFGLFSLLTVSLYAQVNVSGTVKVMPANFAGSIHYC
ncbi:MAG: hypothetical protein IPF54_24225 [Draconibacterium sp.]|nr:hypothetical protein [Draconibacterium sp.]